MKKKGLKLLALLATLTVALGVGAACGGGGGGGGGGNGMKTEYVVEGATEGVLTVGSDVDTLVLDDYVSVAEGYTIGAYEDETGYVYIGTTVDLEYGENRFYVLVFNDKGESEAHLLTVIRLRVFTVSFDLDGGEGTFPDVEVDEGGTIAQPETEPTRPGFDFVGWDYNFSSPVQGSITITALWQQRYSSYTVEHYVTDDGVTEIKQDELTEVVPSAPVGSTVYAEAEEIVGYSLYEPDSTVEGVVEDGGTLVLKLVYYKDMDVTGKIVDASGAKIAGASVTLVNEENEQQEITVNPDGTFASVLSPGEYTVRASAANKMTASKTVEVQFNSDNAFEITLYQGFADVVLSDTETVDSSPYFVITDNYTTGQGGTVNFYVNQNNGTAQLPGFAANRIYLAGSAETTYAFGAEIVYRYYENGTFVNLAQEATHGQNGLVIAGAGYEMAFLMQGGDIRIMNKDMNSSHQFMQVAVGLPNSFSLGDVRGSRPMLITRDENGLKVYVDGVLAVTVAVDGTIASATGGALTYGASWDGASANYGADWFKTAFAALLAPTQKNAFGFTGLPNATNNKTNNTMFRNYFVSTDLSVVDELTMFGTATVNGNRVQKRVVALVDDESLVKIDSGNWYYVTTTGKLYNCAGKSGYDNNLVFINNVQSGDFHFTAVMKNNSAYTQVGIALTDGTNNVIFNVLGGSGMRVTVNGNNTDTPTWGFVDANGNNLGTATSSGNANVEKKLELVKENGEFKFYMTDIVDGVAGTRYHVWTLTASGFTTEYYMDAAKTKQSATISSTLANVVTSLLSGEVVCGFGNIMGGNAADYPKQVYSQISVQAIVADSQE